jgi:alcohol dehydrogenase YqhD (iron-dependent ADH family)
VTLAAVLNAIPLESDHPSIAATNPTLIFDLTKTWFNFNAVDATSYMYEHYVNQTSSLAWSNPGYNNSAKV